MQCCIDTCTNQELKMSHSYLSPNTQNDIIDIIGFDVIRASIITEIQKARHFSIMADEVSSHNVEHMTLCIRYVDESCDIQEKFIAFLKLQRVRASDITNAIVNIILWKILGCHLLI